MESVLKWRSTIISSSTILNSTLLGSPTIALPGFVEDSLILIIASSVFSPIISSCPVTVIEAFVLPAGIFMVSELTVKSGDVPIVTLSCGDVETAAG